MNTVYLIIWIICGVWCYALAKKQANAKNAIIKAAVVIAILFGVWYAFTNGIGGSSDESGNTGTVITAHDQRHHNIRIEFDDEDSGVLTYNEGQTVRFAWNPEIAQFMLNGTISIEINDCAYETSALYIRKGYIYVVSMLILIVTKRKIKRGRLRWIKDVLIQT